MDADQSSPRSDLLPHRFEDITSGAAGHLLHQGIDRVIAHISRQIPTAGITKEAGELLLICKGAEIKHMLFPEIVLFCWLCQGFCIISRGNTQ
jgi:hypothetical protein